MEETETIYQRGKDAYLNWLVPEDGSWHASQAAAHLSKYLGRDHRWEKQHWKIIRLADTHTMPKYEIPPDEEIREARTYIFNGFSTCTHALRYFLSIGPPGESVFLNLGIPHGSYHVRQAGIRAVEQANQNWDQVLEDLRNINARSHLYDLSLCDHIEHDCWDDMNTDLHKIGELFLELKAIGIRIWVALEACATFHSWLSGFPPDVSNVPVRTSLVDPPVVTDFISPMDDHDMNPEPTQ